MDKEKTNTQINRTAGTLGSTKGKGHRALGTKIDVNDVEIGGLTSIGGLELSAETIDSTTLDSEGGYREFVAGFKDAGEVPLEGYLYSKDDEEGQTKLHGMFDSGELGSFKIKFPDSIGLEWNFKGIVVRISTGASLEDLISFGATIKVSGKPNLEKTI